MSWRAQAACIEPQAQAVFHRAWALEARVQGRHRTAAEDECRAICEGCAVLEECRAWALSVAPEDVAGVAGGMSRAERGVEQRVRRVKAQHVPYLEPTVEPAMHGTVRRYFQHLREGTPPCGGCTEAHASYNQQKKEERQMLADELARSVRGTRTTQRERHSYEKRLAKKRAV